MQGRSRTASRMLQGPEKDKYPSHVWSIARNRRKPFVKGVIHLPGKKETDHAGRYLIVYLLVLLLAVPTAFYLTSTGEGDIDVRGGSIPTRDGLDIAIDAIDIVRSGESTNIYPGQKIEIWVLLVHDDNPVQSTTPITKENKFTVILVVDDTFDNVTTQYKDVTNMGTFYTGEDPVDGGPNPPFVVKFFFQVPLKKPAGATSWDGFQFKMTAAITVDDDDKSDNFKSGSGIRISEPEFSPYIWEEGQKTDQTIGPVHTTKLEPPFTIEIPFLLQNKGPAVDEIGIELLQAPEGWKIPSFQPMTVYPNEEIEMTLFFTIPSNPVLSQSDGVYSIVMKAYSTYYPGPYEMDSSHTFRVQVEFKPGLYMVSNIPEGENYLKPGMKHDVYFLAKNTGNGKDTFTFSSYIDEVHIKKGWKVGSPIPSQKELLPDQEWPIKVSVTIPEDAAKWYFVNIFLMGKSGRSVTFEARSEAMMIFASTSYDADIETPNPEGYWVEPGRENAVYFNFTNLGNDKDPDQTLVVDRKPIGWAVYIDLTPLKSGRGLGVRSTTMITMNIFVPDTAYTTDFVSRPKIIVKAYGSPFHHELDSETFEFNIPPRQKVELSSPEPEKEGFIGGQVDFIVNVRNAGNWLDTFNVSVDSEWAFIEEDILKDIYPGGAYPLKVSVKIPKDAAADTNPDTPFPVDPEKNWYDGYRIVVSAYSQNGPSPSATLKTYELILHVQPYYDFTMRIDPAEKPLRFSMDHDQNRAVRVELNNTGNIADLIKLDWLDNPYDWLRLQNTYIDLPDNEVAYAVLNINPRRGDVQETGTIEVTLVGVSRKDPDQKLKVELEISIEFFSLQFQFGDARKNNETMQPTEYGDLGATYSFQVPIENIGTTDLDPTIFDKLFVVLYDGPFELDRANITYLPVGDEKTVIFSATFATPGPHILTFALEGDIPISDKGDIEEQRTLIIRDSYVPPSQKEEIPLWAYLLPLTLIVIFITAIFVFVVKYNQIFISPIDTGYDEDGQYRPWAVKEKFKEGEKEELAPGTGKEALPPPEKPSLPPAPGQAAPVPAGAAQQGARPLAAGQPARPPMPQGARPPAPGQPARPPMPQGARPPAPGQPAKPLVKPQDSGK